MSVNGLERITDRILGEARSRASAVLEQARTESEALLAEGERRAEEIRAELSRAAEAKAAAMIAEAKALAVTKKNEILLAKKSALVESVFADAQNDVASMEPKKYTELLGGLTAAAIYEFCKTEAENRARYGDEDEESAAFEVVLNKKDREGCGEAVLETARRRLSGKIPEEDLKTATLSKETRKMQGGVVLRRGSVELNCSFEMLFGELRRDLEGQVSGVLFDFRGNGI